VVVNEVQGEEEGYLPMGPQKPNSRMGSRETLGSAAWTAFEDVDGLGADEDAGQGGAAGVADGDAEDGDFEGLGGTGAEADALEGFGDVQLVAQCDDAGGGGRVGEKDGGEEGSLTPAKSNGPLSVSPLLTFLGSTWLKAPSVVFVELSIGVGGAVGGLILIAEAAGPG
jgi:hypothetical protein